MSVMIAVCDPKGFRQSLTQPDPTPSRKNSYNLGA